MTLVLRWFWCNHPICFYSGKLASNRKEGLRNCIETQRWKITQKSHSATLRQYLSTRDILGDFQTLCTGILTIIASRQPSSERCFLSSRCTKLCDQSLVWGAWNNIALLQTKKRGKEGGDEAIFQDMQWHEYSEFPAHFVPFCGTFTSYLIRLIVVVYYE